METKQIINMKTSFFKFHTSLSGNHYNIKGSPVFIWELYWRGYNVEDILEGKTNVNIVD